jgi:hypothetical protein
MNYPSIRIEGAILSPDILDRLEDIPGQRPTDFSMESTARVKDEIARAWADAQDYWRIFQRRLDTLRSDSPATTETRQQWMIPLLGLIGYQLDYQPRGVELNSKLYAISHRVTNRGNTPLHIIGCREPSGLDRKPEKAILRMSAHAMVQEYLNLQDELYGLVSNGRVWSSLPIWSSTSTAFSRMVCLPISPSSTACCTPHACRKLSMLPPPAGSSATIRTPSIPERASARA